LALRIIIQLSPGDVPRLQDASIDWRVLAFTLLVTALTGILFGIAPALQASRSICRTLFENPGAAL